MPPAEVPDQRVTDGRRVIEESARIVAQADDAAARIVGQRFIAVVGQANEGMMHVHRDGIAVGRHAREVPAGRLAGERHDRLELRIIGKRLRAWQEDRGAVTIDLVVAFLQPRQSRAHAMGIADQERGRIDDRRPVLRVEVREAPDDRTGERLGNRLPLMIIVAGRAVLEIVLDKENFRPAAQEAHDLRCAELAAIEPQIIGAHAARQRRLVDERCVEVLDTQQDATLVLIPPEIDEAFMGVVRVESQFVGQGRSRPRKAQQGQQGPRLRWHESPSGVARNATRDDTANQYEDTDSEQQFRV